MSDQAPTYCPAPADAPPSEYSHGRPFVACGCGCGLDVPPPTPHSRHARLYATDACRARVRNRKLAAALVTVERQRSLPLTPPPEPIIPVRDQRVPKARRRGFGEQAQALLSRLEEGPCANWEMARMFPPATAWRSRLSDARWELRRRLGLRKDEDPIPGYDCGGGLWWYWLEAVLCDAHGGRGR